MKQGHGFCRVGGWGGGAVVGKPGEKVAFEQSLLGGGEHRSGSRGNSPSGPKRQPDVPVGKVGDGGPAGLIDPCVWNRTGLGSVCVCKNMRESWLYWGSRGVLSARVCGFVSCPVCVRVCAH